MHIEKLGPDHPAWPRGLSDLKRPPSSLHLWGTVPRDLPAIGIVGTRQPTLEALDLTRSIASDLGRSGVLIISGGAYGIDAAAHQAALDVGGVTVAVLATPLGRPYPPDHGPLFDRIAERGGLLSETPEGAWVGKASFLGRNRLIAAMADVVLVVQAPFKSGALSTAAHAVALKRPLYTCPWSPFEEAAQGNLDLLVDGRARLARHAKDLAVALGVTLRAPEMPEQPSPEQLALSLPATPSTEPILAALTRDPQHPDALAQALDLPMSALQPALLELVLSGQAEQVGSGYRRRARKRGPA